MASFSSNDSTIDSRDVTVAADEYRNDIEFKEEEISDAQEELEAEDAVDEQVEISERLEQLQQELSELQEEAEDIFAFEQDCESYASGGSTLINESYFAEYVEELARECGDISENSWLYSYIDWDRAAEDCKMDYTTITFEGTDFYVNG